MDLHKIASRVAILMGQPKQNYSFDDLVNSLDAQIQTFDTSQYDFVSSSSSEITKKIDAVTDILKGFGVKTVRDLTDMDDRSSVPDSDDIVIVVDLHFIDGDQTICVEGDAPNLEKYVDDIFDAVYNNLGSKGGRTVQEISPFAPDHCDIVLEPTGDKFTRVDD